MCVCHKVKFLNVIIGVIVISNFLGCNSINENEIEKENEKVRRSVWNLVANQKKLEFKKQNIISLKKSENLKKNLCPHLRERGGCCYPHCAVWRLGIWKFEENRKVWKI